MTGWHRVGHVLASASVAVAAWSLPFQVYAVAWMMGRDPRSVLRYDMVPAPFTSLSAARVACTGLIVAAGVVVLAQLIALVRSARGSTRRASDWVALLAPLPLAVAMAVCAFDLPGDFLPRIATQAGFERMSGMKLPAGTVFIEARGFKGFKQTVQAAVRMPRAALRPFLESSFAASVAIPGDEHPGVTIKRMRREDLRNWPYVLHAYWRPLSSDRLIVATANTFYIGDGHDALAIATDDGHPMVEVILQYERG